MRGHGTYLAPSRSFAVHASVAGTLSQVNRLVSVLPLRSRYNGEIGDVVVGRVTEVAQKRWKADVNERQDAVLMLSSVNLPGGVQRRKSESDERQMRSFFAEGDLLVAEVQAFFGDGAASLHTRSLKYGKLRNGVLVKVPPSLVARSRAHFHSLPCGVDVILGINGNIWVSKPLAKPPDETDPELLYADYNDEMTPRERENIARVANCVRLLTRALIVIHYHILICTYEASLEYEVGELFRQEVTELVAEEAIARAMMVMDEA